MFSEYYIVTIKSMMLTNFTAIFNNLIGLFTLIQQRAIMRAKDCNSAWLSVIPLEILIN